MCATSCAPTGYCWSTASRARRTTSGSGDSPTIQDVLDGLLALTDAAIDVQQDPARMRPSDVKVLWADPSEFRSLSGAG